MKVLVTGGAGFIASHTDVELLNAGYEVVVLDNLYNSCEESLNRVEKITGKKVKFYNEDIRNEEGMEKIFQIEKPDAVIHFAGLKAVAESVAKPLEFVLLLGNLLFYFGLFCFELCKLIHCKKPPCFEIEKTVR